RTQPGERCLRLLCPARIVGTGKTRQVGLAHGESAGLFDAAALAQGPVRSGLGADDFLSGTQRAADRLRGVHAIPLRMESAAGGLFAGVYRDLRGHCFRRIGRHLREEIRRALQRPEWLVLWRAGLSGICAGLAWLDAARDHSLYRAVGRGWTGDSVADVA